VNPLADSQTAFARALRDPGLPAPADIRRPADALQTRRFDVHRNNFVVSLIEALEAAFPAVRKLVGEAFFKGCARAFIDAAPPTSPVLLLYGRGFGDFLDRFEPARTVPYLGDVARLEWAQLDAYHAADVTPARIEALAALPQAQVGGARFALHPSFALIRSRWPVVSLWSASTGGEPAAGVDMTRGEDGIVVRPALAVDTRIAPVGGGSFMARLQAGDTLEHAARAATEETPGFDLASHLQGLFAIGAVAAVTLAPPSDAGSDKR
jgi:hypothetical protein